MLFFIINFILFSASVLRKDLLVPFSRHNMSLLLIIFFISNQINFNSHMFTISYQTNSYTYLYTKFAAYMPHTSSDLNLNYQSLDAFKIFMFIPNESLNSVKILPYLINAL